MSSIRKWQGIWPFLKEVWLAYDKDNGSVAAAGVAFYLLLSMVPLLLLLISVAAFFTSQAQAENLAIHLSHSFGRGVGGALRVEFLSVVKIRGLLTGVSLLLGLWSSSQVFVVMELALDQIWGVTDRRPWWVRYGLALLMVIVSGVLLAIAVGLTYLVRMLSRVETVSINGHHLHQFPLLIGILLTWVLPALVAVVAFTIIYRFLSARKVSWEMALPGAVIGATAWELSLQAFSWYTATYANYTRLYGSLSSLVLLMLWFNYSTQILLLGAECSAVLTKYRQHTDRSTKRGTKVT